MAPIGVAVLGYGMSATGTSSPRFESSQLTRMRRIVFHIPFLLSLKDDFTLVSVLERKATETSSEVRRTLPGVKVVTTLDEVLKDPLVELVVISTINDTHYEYTKVSIVHESILRVLTILPGHLERWKARRMREAHHTDVG